jgi:hypothetical protein
MSTYSFDDLQGAGTGSQDLTAGTQYTFTITNNSGSSYFTMETPRNFDGVTPRNLSGSITSASSGVVFNQSDYIAGFALPTGNNSFVFTPSTNVTGSTLKLRGTGGIYVELSGSGGSVIDADAQAFLTAAAITDPTITSAIDTLVVQLKADNIWTKMKALYPFVGGTATTHKYNLKDPRDLDAAFRLTFSGGWTHSSTGATPNGTNAYADTKLIPNTTLSLNSTHISGYLRTNLNSNAPILSSENSGTYNNGLYIWPKQVSFGYSVRINDNTSQGGGTRFDDIRGFHVALRTSSNVKKYRLNNTERFNVTTASTALNTSSIYIAASRNNANYFNNELAFSSIGDGLTDAEAANYYTAVQTFQTSLNRQV